jgi:hypothetical protein
MDFFRDFLRIDFSYMRLVTQGALWWTNGSANSQNPAAQSAQGCSLHEVT